MVGIKLGAAMAVHSCIVSWARIYFICVSHRFIDHLLCVNHCPRCRGLVVKISGAWSDGDFILV